MLGKFGVALLLVAAILFAMACAPVQPQITVEPEQKEEILRSQTRLPLLPPQAGDAAYEAVNGKIDIQAALMDEAAKAVYAAWREQGYTAFTQQRATLEASAARLKAALEAAAEAGLKKLLSRRDEAKGELKLELEGLTWQYAAAIGAVWGADIALDDLVDVELKTPASKQLILTLSLRDIRDALYRIAGKDANRYSTGRFTYAYLTTVYDDQGKEKKYVHPALPEGYEDTVVFPLGVRTSRRNGWYKDRDKGTRKHTGMDLRAPEDTPILSCTDGVVVAIGCNAKAGNYVLVLDDLGYEYHYYHMVRMTKFLQQGEKVKAGQVIGHVGNTGNSDANHLHLTMITPQNTYINPYYLMKKVYPF